MVFRFWIFALTYVDGYVILARKIKGLHQMRNYRTIKTKPVRSGPPPVAKYSSKLFATLAQQTKFVDPKLGAQWRTLVGDELAHLCRPGRLTGGRTGCTLEVFTQNAASAAKVQFEAETIRQRVNVFLGPDTVARISVLHREDVGNSTGSELNSALSRFRSTFSDRNESR